MYFTYSGVELGQFCFTVLNVKFRKVDKTKFRVINIKIIS